MREMFKGVTDFNDIDADHIREYAVSMANAYSGDLQSGEFADEMIQFVDFAKSPRCQTPSSLAMLLDSEDLQTSAHFSESRSCNSHVDVTKVSNCSGKRSLSKMDLIKNKLRSSVSDRR